MFALRRYRIYIVFIIRVYKDFWNKKMVPKRLNKGSVHILVTEEYARKKVNKKNKPTQNKMFYILRNSQYATYLNSTSAFSSVNNIINSSICKETAFIWFVVGINRCYCLGIEIIESYIHRAFAS